MGSAPATSAIPPIADIRLRCNICREGPITDIALDGPGERLSPNSVLDQSHHNVCLNFGRDFAASVSVCDLGGGVVGRSLQFVRIPGFDLVA